MCSKNYDSSGAPFKWFGGIRKVKAVSPSPFYDGKYHPPLLGQLSLLYILRYTDCKVSTLSGGSNFLPLDLCTQTARLPFRSGGIRYATGLSWPTVPPLFPYTSHRVHNNLRDKPLRIGALHENPGIRYTY